MKLSSGYPFSLVKHGLPFTYPKLDRDIRPDVVIVGGGISGALMAHSLVSSGIDCVLIDARSIGLGSTCASTSLLQYEIDIPLHKLIAMIGVEQAVRSYKLGEYAIMKLVSLCKKVGMSNVQSRPSLYFAAYKKHIEFLRDEYDARKKFGFMVNYLGEKEVAGEFGFNAPAAILSDKAATVDSYHLTHQIFQYYLSKGLQVYDRTRAVEIRHEKAGVRIKTAEGFFIKAKKLVYATGYEVVNYISEPIVKLSSTYAAASESFNEPIRFGSRDAVMWSTASPYLYLRTTNDNRVIIGGRDEEFFSHTRRDKLIPKKTKQLTSDFEKLFPSVPFKPEFSWAGVFGSTKDGLPYIGPYKKLPNSFFALGFGGNGITFSQIAGEIIADLIKGKRNKDAALFCFER